MKGSLSVRLSFVILLLLPPTTHAAYVSLSGFECLCPYIGMEAQLRYMPFDKESGANLFPKRFPQGNIFAGIQWNDYWGLEAGYENSVNKHRHVVLIRSVNNISSQIEENNAAKIFGPHLNVTGHYALSTCPDLNLVGTLGLAYLKSRLKVKMVSVDGVPHDTLIKFSNTKWVSRIGGGLQYSVNKQVSIRGMIIWENTKKFKRIPAQNLSSDYFVKLKDSTIMSLGILLNF